MLVTRHQRLKGFTLIEIMIVIGIMGIIAAIAIPSYTNSVQNARRADCVAVLEETRQKMERYYARNFKYDGVVAGQDYPAKAPKTGDEIYCSIEVSHNAEGEPPSYTITATPEGLHEDDKCGELKIEHTGKRTAALPVDECF